MYSLFARSTAFDQIRRAGWFPSGRRAGTARSKTFFPSPPWRPRCVVLQGPRARRREDKSGLRSLPAKPPEMLSAKGVESPQASSSLRAHALLQFGLPTAPERIEELVAPVSTASACRVHTPEGRFLLLCAATPLALAFEATLFDLLVEARFPVPGPRRARAGGLIAVLGLDGVRAAASCYAWPPGETLDPATARIPQLLEIGRLLGRLHRLGE